MSKCKRQNSVSGRMQNTPQQTSLPGMEADTPWEEMHLSLKELYSGQPYQRPVKNSWVDELVRKWDPRLSTPLVVSGRDGR